MQRLGRLLEAARRHWRAVDAAVAVALAGLVMSEVFTSDVTGDPALLVPTSLAIVLPLAWRRVAPLPAVAVTMIALGVQGVLDQSPQEPQTTLIAVLLALYSVGAHAERNPALAGLVLGVVALLVNEPGDAAVMVPVFTGIWFAGRLVRSREADARRLRELAEALDRERVEAGRVAVAEERARIARELHDVVAHAMSVVVLEAGAERVNLPEGRDSTSEVLRSIERTGRGALAEMRRLVGLLRDDDEPAALAPRPSLARVEGLVEQVRRTGLPVELRVEGRPVALAPGLDMSAYRIVQEALTNVLKHAGDAQASVLVGYGERTLAIEVADDGRGGEARAGGHGLAGMRQRAGLFGGELEAGPRPAGGFVVRARLPIEVDA